MQKLGLRIYGPFSATWADGRQCNISSSKHRALLALLATAPEGFRTRAWLHDMLWSLSGADHGRASLRRALSDLRNTFGGRFVDHFRVSNKDIGLTPDAIELVGCPADGIFLEGIAIREPNFNTWLEEFRNADTKRSLPKPKSASKNLNNGLQPSIAVLQFNLQTDETGHPIGDMVAQEIARTMSTSKYLDVISYLSSSRFRPTQVDLKSVQEMLAVDFFVHGTIISDRDQLRVDTELVDATTGIICGTKEAAGSLLSFLNGDKDMIVSLSRGLAHAVNSKSIERSTSGPLPSVESHALLAASISLMHRQHQEEFFAAREHLEELLHRHPRQSILHAWLGKWFVLSMSHGWSADISADTIRAIDCVSRALDLNPCCSFSLTIQGLIQHNNFSEAFLRFEEAIDLDPNNALAWIFKSRLHSFSGEGALAVECADRARKLSPIDPQKYLFDCVAATACVANNELERALSFANQSLRTKRKNASALRARTVTLDLMGRAKEARATVCELMRVEPSLTVQSYLNNHPAAEYSIGRQWANSLRRAGVPAT
jgi:TolB-like protein/tetratricopeptide (TPR) repeat protein